MAEQQTEIKGHLTGVKNGNWFDSRRIPEIVSFSNSGQTLQIITFCKLSYSQHFWLDKDWPLKSSALFWSCTIPTVKDGSKALNHWIRKMLFIVD